MTRYLLDSDAVMDYLAGGPDSVALIRNLRLQGNELCCCDITVAEVHAGLLPQHRAAGMALLASLTYLPTSFSTAQQAGEWKFTYARRGITLSITDCLIAATALAHQAHLVTGNLKHYPMPEITVLPLPRNRS
jgi:predicted nucleic acid-binding protein